MKNIFFVGIIFLMIVSCSDNLAVFPDYSPGWQSPLVKGMELMDENAISIGVWGSPDFPEGSKKTNSPGLEPETFLRMDTPYPNPSYGNFWIRYEIRRPSKVKVWITPARWISEPKNSYVNGMGGTFIDINGSRAVEILADGSQEYPPGMYLVMFINGSESNERKVLQGFFRVYVQTDGETLWRDIYIGYPCQKAPPGLNKYLNYCPDR